MLEWIFFYQNITIKKISLSNPEILVTASNDEGFAQFL